MLQALLFTATALVFLCCIFFVYKKWYMSALLMLLFYNLNIFNCTFQYAIIYYVKWLIFCGIGVVLFFLTVFRKPYIINYITKKPLIYGLLFIISAIISALLSENTIEALIRASSFFILISISLFVITAKDQEIRASEVLFAIYCFDIVVVLLSLLGATDSSLWLAGRLVGLLYPNATGMVVYAYSSLIVAFALLWSIDRYRWFHLLIAAGSLILIILTQSRAGYLAVICGLVCVLGLLLSRKGFLVLAYGLLLGMIAFALFATSSVSEIGQSILRGSSVEEIGGPRLYYMNRAFQHFQKNPLWGIGMGTVPEDIVVDDIPERPFSSSAERVANQTGYHLLLVETGIVGLLFYLSWLLSSFYIGKSICEYLKMTDNRKLLTYYAAFLGLFVAYAAHGIFEGFPSGAGNIVAVRMWALSGMFMAFKHLSQKSRAAITGPSETTMIWEKA